MLVKIGDKGQIVEAMQAALGVAADGKCGPVTLAALKAWKNAYGVADSAALSALGVEPTLGVDLSHWQATVDAAPLAGAVRFAYLKATQGAGGVDRAFAKRRAELRAAGLKVGAYAFAVPSRDTAIATARQLKATVGELAHGELAPALDLEAYVKGMDPAAVRAWARDCLAAIADLFGVRPVLYTGYAFLHGNLGGGDAELATYPLWIARYRGADAIDPGPVGAWPSWRIWQFTCAATIAGVKGGCDANRLVGGFAGLSIP